MDSDSDEDEYAQPARPMNAFDEMMAKTKTSRSFLKEMSDDEESDESADDADDADDVDADDDEGPHDPGGEYWGAIYIRTLLRPTNPEDPLIGNAYVGQTVRAIGKQFPTALAAAEVRWKQEDRVARRGDGSDLNFLELLRIHGPDAFENQLVSETRGLKPDRKVWANAFEKAEIASRGGPMRDMAPVVHIEQTFNRTDGGQGDFTFSQAAVSSKAWKCFQKELQQYFGKEKTALVPISFVSASGYRLGKAVNSVRCGRVDGYPERRAWLDSLEGWSWNARDALWETFKAELQQYVDKNKTALVLRSFVSASGYSLGKTVNSVRNEQFVKNHPERRAWLDSLKGWSWNVNDDAWETFRAELQQYVDKNKTALVLRSFVSASGYRLGETVHSVRGGRVDGYPERRAWLDSLEGWSWNVNDDAWETFKEELQQHIVDKKTALVPRSFVSASGYRLGKFVNAVRNEQFVKNHPERRAWLDSLKGWSWNANDTAWETFRAELQQYVDKNKTALVLRSFVSASGYRLGQTVSDVRQGHQVKNHPERAAWLDSLPDWLGDGKVNKKKNLHANARRAALPYELVMAKRVHGAFYHRLSDDMILRCESNKRWKNICPATEP